MRIIYHYIDGAWYQEVVIPWSLDLFWWLR